MDPIYQLGFKNERATLFFFIEYSLIGLYKGQECIHFVTRFFT